MFNFMLSIDTILKVFTKMSTQLDKVIAAEQLKGVQKATLADELTTESRSHIQEATRAAKIKVRLESLIS